jgi:hypothetical protein|tara:strand:- start:2138 stop:2347 length:210 start_codon:yes stop_codon:yes gene_type:complete
MGKVKAWMMDREEKFNDKISEIIGECETWHEFSSRMENHMHLMDHVPLTDLMDILAEDWNEYWSKHREG